MSTPPIPQTTVSQRGMLSRSPGAKNLPSRPMMMPAMMTPMMSTRDPFHLLETAWFHGVARVPVRPRAQSQVATMAQLRAADHSEHLKGPRQPAGHGKADPAGLILAVGGHMAKQAGELGTRFRAGSPPSDEVR